MPPSEDETGPVEIACDILASDGPNARTWGSVMSAAQRAEMDWGKQPILCSIEL